MVEIEIPGRSGDIGRAILTAAESMGLRITSDGALRMYPGSRHWHLKRVAMSGTLEATWWPSRDRLWVTYHSNRVGNGWVKEAAPQFAALLARELGGEPIDYSETSGCG